MVLWDDIRSKLKLDEAVDNIKKGFSFAADKTKKGATSARVQVQVRIERGKINKLYGDLGKYSFGLMSNGVFDMSNDTTIKKIVDDIKKSEDAILKLHEEMKLSQG